MAALLELQDVRAGYGGGEILHGVDLSVEPGTIVCIIGPNGAGKSTVLRVVGGHLSPSAGEVRLGGETIAGIGPRQVIERGVAHVPQERSLFPKMSVLENVRIGGYVLARKRDVSERLEEVASSFEIVRAMGDRLAGSLSGGQQKQVELARAMMLRPRLLLLDEPSDGLDEKMRALVFDKVEQLRSEGIGILLVEQNARSGLTLATKGVLLEAGTIRLTGSGSDLLANKDIAKIYLGAMVR